MSRLHRAAALISASLFSFVIAAPLRAEEPSPSGAVTDYTQTSIEAKRKKLKSLLEEVDLPPAPPLETAARKIGQDARPSFSGGTTPQPKTLDTIDVTPSALPPSVAETAQPESGLDRLQRNQEKLARQRLNDVIILESNR